MKYDFDKLTDRVGSGSLKWDVSEGELPMWVADMSFPTAPSVVAAMRERLDHASFGYFMPRAERRGYARRRSSDSGPDWCAVGGFH